MAVNTAALRQWAEHWHNLEAYKCRDVINLCDEVEELRTQVAACAAQPPDRVDPDASE